MAWPISAFNSRSTADWAGDLYALRRAVYQRKAAMGYTLGSGDAVALEDGVGLDLFGADLRDLLQGVRDDIQAMVEDPQTEAYFVTADEGDTAVTMAWLESQTGLDDPGDPTVPGQDGVDVRNAAHWEFCRAALDLLIYAKVVFSDIKTEGTWDLSERGYIAYGETQEQAWDGVVAATPTTITSNPRGPDGLRDGDPPSIFWANGSSEIQGYGYINTFLQITIPTGKFDGSASSGLLSYGVGSARSLSGGSIVVSLPGGNSHTFDTDSVSAKTVSPVISADQVLTFTFPSEPSSSPFEVQDICYRQLYPTSYTFYLDLSSVLTDQA